MLPAAKRSVLRREAELPRPGVPGCIGVGEQQVAGAARLQRRITVELIFPEEFAKPIVDPVAKDGGRARCSVAGAVAAPIGPHQRCGEGRDVEVGHGQRRAGFPGNGEDDALVGGLARVLRVRLDLPVEVKRAVDGTDHLRRHRSGHDAIDLCLAGRGGRRKAERRRHLIDDRAGEVRLCRDAGSRQGDERHGLGGRTQRTSKQGGRDGQALRRNCHGVSCLALARA